METLHFKNISVNYTDSGKGTAVVLLHGFLENATMWDAFIPELSQKYRVITIDLLGHGKTQPLNYVQTMEDNADMVLSVLNELRIRKAIFVGHSMGGYVALAFADLFPNIVKGVALVNSTAKPDSAERKLNRDRAIVAVKQNYASFVRMSVANLFSEDNRERFAKEIEAVKFEALKTPLQGIVASLEGMKIRKDRELLLHEGKFPVLLVLGKKDPVLNFEETQELKKHPNVSLEVFPDGHMSPIENRRDLQTVLHNFLKRC
ncbi:2-hydroxy-6-oxononadienedioate/2-hydroxy-6-oxononatrienedioate hydrolase [Flavobacterium longum]|uniref:alpha/beta fold hydrolase n=1 Tax=Flavobacterium longum TaxID=1299340 RepID=UPI0039E7681B